MLKNYFNIAIRSLFKRKVYSIINIVGLAVGLSCCVLISLFILDELSYDKFHSKSDRIYRVSREYLNAEGIVDIHVGRIAPPIAPLLKEHFPQIEETVRLFSTYGSLFLVDDRSFQEDNAFYAEENIFKVFDFDIIKGSPEEALTKPFSIMLSEEMAKKYFQNEDPIGKVITWKLRDEKFSLKVTGIFKNLPLQSHFHPEFLISFKTLENPNIYQSGPDPNDSKSQGKAGLARNWGNNAFVTYLLLPEEKTAKNLENQLDDFIDKTYGVFAKKEGWIDGNEMKASDFNHLYLQKLTDIHLYSHLDEELETNGDINTIYIFIVIGVFILLIACVNFINLSTARSALRAKEVGVRKVIGAYRRSLIFQFLSESILITSLAMLLGLGLAEASLPFLNDFIGKELYIAYWNPFIVLLLLGFVLIVGLLAGIYPSIYLSSFKPVKVLKGKLFASTKKSSLRTVLVTIQFSISVLLIICTSIIYQQLNFIKNKELGFDQEAIISLPYDLELTNQFDAFRQELLQNTGVVNLSRSNQIPSERLLNSFGSASDVEIYDSITNTDVLLKFVLIDHYFMDTYGIKLAAGRNFLENRPTDDTAAFLLNETAVKQIGWKKAEYAVEKRFTYANRKGKVVGVMKDVNLESMHEEVKPIVYLMGPFYFYSNISIKLKGENLSQNIAFVEKTWEKFLPDTPFQYEFIDESIAQLYVQEERQGTLFFIFAGLAIFIACLGLFGLASFIAEQKTKEISIRKVLGASIPQILQLMSRNFIILVLVASVVAFPFAYYGMYLWLQDFAYKINLNTNWYIFIISSLIALSIAIFTISTQVLKVATVNPANTLRNE